MPSVCSIEVPFTCTEYKAGADGIVYLVALPLSNLQVVVAWLLLVRLSLAGKYGSNFLSKRFAFGLYE